MTALERAVSYLTVKPRTRKQVADYLVDRGFDSDTVRETVSQLEEYHYIDDREYARMYFAAGFEKGHGQSRIVRELREKGVDSFVIEDVLYQLESEEEIPDQFESALRAGRDVLGNLVLKELDYKERQKLEARVGRRLASRGFETSLIYKVIRALEEER